MEEKYLITTKKSFCTKDGSYKNACWGKVIQEQDTVTVGNEGKDISFNCDNVLAILRCDEKPVQSNDLGFPEDRESELAIYIAE